MCIVGFEPQPLQWMRKLGEKIKGKIKCGEWIEPTTS